MNILIRSQNKKYLLNPVSIEIDDYIDGSGYTIYGTTRAEDRYIIGVYSTLKKALKVIDLVEVEIKKPCKASSAQEQGVFGLIVMKTNNYNDKIFHMPQDSEVRV